jgi:uncharacterized protein YabE (DUF348 family)
MVVVGLVVFAGFRLFEVSRFTILNQGEVFAVETTLGDGREALQAAGVVFAPGDDYRFARSGGGLASISVGRASPVVLSVDGRQLTLRTRAQTVGGALAEIGAELGPGDRVLINGQFTGPEAPLSAAEPLVRLGGASSDAAMISIAVERARPVAVVVDDYRIDTRSAASSVRELLAEMGLSVREGDLVSPPLESPVAAGLVVRLANARTITVVVDGVEETLYTQAATVDEVLELLAINPAEGDILDPPRGSRLLTGAVITVGLTRLVTESLDEPVPATIAYETSTAIPAGSVQIIPGADGVLRRHFDVTYRNGTEISRTETGGEIIQAPVPVRHIIGASPTTTSSPILDTPAYTGPYLTQLSVWATWYNATHGGKDRSDPYYGITSTGILLEHGICAVDPSVIPLGTRFVVPGYGVCLAADVGGGINGAHIDLGFAESAGNNPWATSQVEIYILD